MRFAMQPIGSWLERLCTGVALAGALLLVTLIGLETVSVVGRSLPDLLGWTGLKLLPHAIPGDSEIAQAITAVALFSFLPYCQMRGGHIRVEVFSRSLPAPVIAFLDVLWNIAFMLLAAVLSWRLGVGWLSKLANGDSSMVLRIPDAIPFGAAVFCTLLLLASVAYCLSPASRQRNTATAPMPQPHG